MPSVNRLLFICAVSFAAMPCGVQRPKPIQLSSVVSPGYNPANAEMWYPIEQRLRRQRGGRRVGGKRKRDREREKGKGREKRKRRKREGGKRERVG